MKHFIYLPVVCVGLSCFAQTIVLPANPSKGESKATEELVTHFRLSTGKDFKVVNEGGAISGPGIYVGKTAKAAGIGIDFGKFEPEEWALKSVGKDLVLGGGFPRGTLYAAFEFLERHVGALWLDERTTVVKKGKDISWPGNMNLRGKPSFRVRGLYAYHREPHFARRLFMARNRQNLFHDEPVLTEIEDWEVFPAFGAPRACHTYYNYTEKWGDAEEECFSLNKDGKRLRAKSAAGPGQVCMTNPRARELFLQKLREYIKADRAKYPAGAYPVMYEVSANDNYDKCECKECLAAAEKYQSYGGVVLEFTNYLAANIAKEYPDVMVEMFAYMYSEQPPVGIKAHPNTLVRIAQLGGEFNENRETLRSINHPHNAKSKEQILGWSKIAPLAIWDYWIFYRNNNSVTSCFDALRDNFKFYKEVGVKSIFVEVEKPFETIFYALRLWLGYRLLNNSSLDANEQIDLFMESYYGAAAGRYMKELLAYIEKRNGEITGRQNKVALALRTDLDEAFFKTANDLLAKAMNAADSADIKRRISKEQYVVDYTFMLKPVGKADYKAIRERMVRDLPCVIQEYGDASTIKDRLEELKLQMDGLELEFPVPEELKGRTIAFDYAWPNFPNKFYRSNRVPVPDALGGRALVLELGNPEGIFKYGYYKIFEKDQTCTFTKKRGELPKDEKFHLYSLGRIKFAPSGYVWMHFPTWELQHQIDGVYKPGEDNEYELFLSIKVQGPSYVEGSKSKDAVMLDRVILVK